MQTLNTFYLCLVQTCGHGQFFVCQTWSVSVLFPLMSVMLPGQCDNYKKEKKSFSFPGTH